MVILFKNLMKPAGNIYDIKTVIESRHETTGIRSLDAKSEMSVDIGGQNQTESLLMKLFLLEIEVDRKDYIIKEILQCKGSQVQITELTSKITKQEFQIQTLNESLTLMKNQLSRYERESKDIQLYKSRAQFNSELEEKVFQLEARLKKSQEEKIEMEEINKKQKLDLAMRDCEIERFKGNQRSKLNEYQNYANQIRMQLDSEKRANIQKNIIIEKLNYQINELKNLRVTYEEKIKLIKNEYAYNENLKKSQISQKQEKVSQISQQIGRLSEQNKHLHYTIDNLKYDLQNKDQKIQEGLSAYKQLQSSFNTLDTRYKEISFKYDSRQKEILFKDRETGDKQSLIHRLQTDNDELRRIFTLKLQQSNNQLIEITNTKDLQIKSLSDENGNLQNQIRKLKRKPIAQSILCQNCRLKEAFSTKSITSMGSMKSMNNVNLTQIIESTQQLQKSTKRIESLINPVLIQSKTIIQRASYHEIK